MISKKVSFKNTGKGTGRLGRLVKYLTSDQGKTVRVGDVRIINCRSTETDLNWAVKEMTATQDVNQTSRANKTYHLLVSFAATDKLAAKDLRDIEDRFVKALGYQEHQRVSVVHYDTGNLHFHVAINKIHPVTHTAHDPYRDYKTRASVCAEVMRDYGLSRNAVETEQVKERTEATQQIQREHPISGPSTQPSTPTQSATIGGTPPLPEGASKAEAVAGVESLISYVRGNLKGAVVEARSWEDLLAKFKAVGVTLKARGNGLVVESNGRHAKASDCFRELSKAALEARFGQFPGHNRPPSSETDQNGGKSRVGYVGRPLAGNSPLFERYSKEQAALRETKPLEVATALARHRQRIAAAKSAFAQQKAIMGMLRGRMNNFMFVIHQASYKRELASSFAKYQQEKGEIHARPRLAWADWLMREAKAGNQEALNTLRKRNERNTTGPHRSNDRRDRGGDRRGPGSAGTSPVNLSRQAAYQSSLGGPPRRPGAAPDASLWDVSGSHMVSGKRGGEVLLPHDAHNHMEPTGAADLGLRRQGVGSSQVGERTVTRNGMVRGATRVLQLARDTLQKAFDWTLSR